MTAAIPSEARAPSRWRAAWPVLLGLGLLAALAYPLAQPRRGANQIRALGTGARSQLFQDARREVTTVCTSPAAQSGTLHDHCVSQAQFLMLFPECDEGCRMVARSVLPHARR
jgi:hypothetical protein